jgi:ribosomal-protein-alanine N-acetyltransferase
MSEIRFLDEKDLDAVASLEMEVFSNPWNAQVLKEELDTNPFYRAYLAEENGCIEGYVSYLITFDSATICRLAVKKEFRRQGIAQRLLDQMVKDCQSKSEPVEWITLEVRESNVAARTLYEKNGWENITIKKNYYENGENAIYMVRSILK